MIQDLFNDYIIYFGDEIPHDISSMICKCSPECDYYIYSTQFSNVPLHDNMNDITLDVHYIGQTSFRYKTDIVITQMDLLGKALCFSLCIFFLQIHLYYIFLLPNVFFVYLLKILKDKL